MGAKENTGARNTREALILAGLEELNEYGIQHFSTRGEGVRYVVRGTV